MTPEENEKGTITGTALNFTWGTSLIAIVAPLGAALLALLGPLKDQPQPTVVAIFGAIAIGLLAAAISAFADALARAWTTAAATAAKERSTANPTGTPVAIRVPHLHPDPIPVITARWDASKKQTWYLVKEPGVRPVWVEEDKVTAD